MVDIPTESHRSVLAYWPSGLIHSLCSRATLPYYFPFDCILTTICGQCQSARTHLSQGIQYIRSFSRLSEGKSSGAGTMKGLGVCGHVSTLLEQAPALWESTASPKPGASHSWRCRTSQMATDGTRYTKHCESGLEHVDSLIATPSCWVVASTALVGIFMEIDAQCQWSKRSTSPFPQAFQD